MNRVTKLSNHIAVNNTAAPNRPQIFGAVGTENDNDVVIVDTVTTAVTKARKGLFKNTTPDDMLVALFKAILERNASGLKPADIDEVIIGNVQMDGAYALGARTASLRAGIPNTATLKVVNRQCSSGSVAISDLAAAIAVGAIDIGIAGGCESMTNGGAPGSKMPLINLGETFANENSQGALSGMGQTSENVAAKYGITRQQQDEFALESNRRSLAALKAGTFNDRIIPVKTMVEDKEGNEKEVVVKVNEGPRETTLEKLGKLRPAFDKENGKSTAGNSSQTSDGAACSLLMRRSDAKKRGLKILATFRGSNVSGVPPEIMGIGPIPAVRNLLTQLNLKISDIDCFELNEAFASQSLVVIKELGLDTAKVNPAGGAISLGHPLGATGAILTTRLVDHLNKNNQKLGVVTMCIGTGMGFALLLEA